MKNLLIALFVFGSLVSQAQTNLDSLYTIWEDETQSDSVRTDAYHDFISTGFLYSNSDTAIILAQNMLQFGEERSYAKAKAWAYYLMGVSNKRLADYPKALAHFQSSLTVYEKMGNKKGQANCLTSIGIVTSSQGDKPKALEYYQRGSKLYEEIGNKSGIAHSLSSIAGIHLFQGEISKALKNYESGLQIFEELEDDRNIANLLQKIGNICVDQGEHLRGIDYFQRSLKLYEDAGDKGGSANAIGNIGSAYWDMQDYPKALEYYHRSLTIFEETGNRNGSAMAEYGIGLLYRRLGNYPKALDYCKKALLSNQEIGAVDGEKRACSCLYKTYKSMGNGTKALEYHELLTVLKDSLFNEKNTKKLTQLEMQFEFDKKEARIQAEQDKKDAIVEQELKRQKLVRNGFMGGFAVVFLFAGVFFVQRNKIGKEKERSEELLLNILPEETARELKEKGHSEAQLIDHVTVLFTDFKGFTALSETLSPKELVEDLHVCFSEFDRICEKYGIEKIKTIGDAYMAAGGLPTPNTTHPQDVAKAALEMAQVVEKGKAKKIANGFPFFEVRIGVHTGPVVAGIVGVKKFQYDIWGDTVNTASRMESSGEVGKVNISEATYKLLKDDAQFSFSSRGKIEAKGKGEMEMYFVEGIA